MPRMISIPSGLGFGDKLPTMSQLPSIPSFSQYLSPPPPPGEGDVKPGTSAQPTTDNQVTSSHPSNPSTPTLSPPTPTPEETTIITQPPIEPISRWLASIGLEAYTDNFHNIGLVNMYDLADFTLEDLQKMKIGTQHRNKIWRALVEHRNTSTLPATQQGAALHTLTQMAPLDVSGPMLDLTPTPPVDLSGNTPGCYEVTRYTFKHTIALKREDGDHDYC